MFSSLLNSKGGLRALDVHTESTFDPDCNCVLFEQANRLSAYSIGMYIAFISSYPLPMADHIILSPKVSKIPSGLSLLCPRSLSPYRSRPLLASLQRKLLKPNHIPTVNNPPVPSSSTTAWSISIKYNDFRINLFPATSILGTRCSVSTFYGV